MEQRVKGGAEMAELGTERVIVHDGTARVESATDDRVTVTRFPNVLSGTNGTADEPPVKEHVAARLCGLSTSSLRRLRHGKAGPPYMRLGSSIRYSLRSVRQWLAEQEVR